MDIIEQFKTGKVAVNCRTEEAAKQFLQKCRENNLTFGTSKIYNTTYWSIYEQNTCYSSYPTGKMFGYAYTNYYEEQGYEIIEYKEDKMVDTLEMMRLLMENPKRRAKAVIGQYIYEVSAEGKSFRNTVKLNDDTFIASEYLTLSETVVNTMWEIIEPEPQPVTFEEARQAYENGKKVEVVFPSAIEKGKIIRNTFWKSVSGGQLQSEQDKNITFYVLRVGKWYIKEE